MPKSQSSGSSLCDDVFPKDHAIFQHFLLGIYAVPIQYTLFDTAIVTYVFVFNTDRVLICQFHVASMSHIPMISYSSPDAISSP